ncbi:MAG: FeoA family protein [Tissierellia bacterium]|nr:FeoA family protein [Tissierellia bacterium]
MNLLMAPKEKVLRIIKVREKRSTDKQEKFLSNLGFVEGANISVITENRGNLIVNIKDSRVALGKDLALRIIVEEID